jgi:DeoR/GlpR family transcriptional regulator of sugar metabolism
VKNYLKDNQILFLDGGSTVAECVPLVHQKGITIVTNGLRTLNLASHNSGGIRMISTGGEMREKSLTLIGDYAKPVIEIYTAHVFLTSGTGLSLENGVTDPDYLEANIKKKMKNQSKMVIALMDSSKWGKNSGVTSISIVDIDVLITDKKAPKEMIEKIREKGVIVEIVE